MVWPTGGTAESGEGKATGCLPAPPAPCFLQGPQRQPCWSPAPPPLGGPLPGSVTDPLLPAVTRRPAVLPVSGGFSDPHLSLASIPSTALSLVERPGESSGRQSPQSPGSLSHSSRAGGDNPGLLSAGRRHFRRKPCPGLRLLPTRGAASWPHPVCQMGQRPRVLAAGGQAHLLTRLLHIHDNSWSCGQRGRRRPREGRRQKEPWNAASTLGRDGPRGTADLGKEPSSPWASVSLTNEQLERNDLHGSFHVHIL